MIQHSIKSRDCISEDTMEKTKQKSDIALTKFVDKIVLRNFQLVLMGFILGMLSMVAIILLALILGGN